MAENNLEEICYKKSENVNKLSNLSFICGGKNNKKIYLYNKEKHIGYIEDYNKSRLADVIP